MPNPEFADAVLAVVARIPPGRVVTYGDIAWALGSQAPRAVGLVLALYGYAVPWWRVVPASGHPPQGHARLALPHYLAEGTPLNLSGRTGVAGRAGRVGTAATSSTEVDPADYRIALSAARLEFDHPFYLQIATEGATGDAPANSAKPSPDREDGL